MVTGFVLLPFVLAALFAGGTAFVMMVMILMLVGALELNHVVTHKYARLSTVISVIVVTLIGLMRPLFGDVNNGGVWLAAMIGLAALFVVVYLSGARQGRVREALIMAGGTAYIALAAYIAIYVRDMPAGFILWMLLFIGTFGMDTFSYIGGRLFGKHRIAPAISPGKTVEGAVIGGICAVIIAIAWLIGTGAFSPVTLTLALVMPLADLAGDLLESWVKRLYGVKDSYIPGLNIMPGHGGVLDRIDGLLMVMLVAAVILSVAGL